MVPVAYGMPGREMWEASERGEILLGGCSLPGPFDPTSDCPQCLLLEQPIEYCADLPLTPDGRIPVGVRVTSRTGVVEGRTTGGRRSSGSGDDTRWSIAVSWRSGQRTFVDVDGITVDEPERGRPDTAGERRSQIELRRHAEPFDPRLYLVRIVDGGELTGRPGADPDVRPESAWPDDDRLGTAWWTPTDVEW